MKRGLEINFEKEIEDKWPLHAAAKCGNLETMTFLLNKGVLPDVKNDEGQTPLHIAVGKYDIKPMILLIESGANVDEQDSSGKAPLHHAVERGQFKITNCLLDYSANMDVQNKSGFTPLHFAIHISKNSIFKLLVEKGADLDVKSYLGWTALHYAAYFGYWKMVKYLLHNGASLEPRTYETLWLQRYKTVKKVIAKHIVKLREVGVDIDESIYLLTANITDEEKLEFLTEALKIWDTKVSKGNYLKEIFTKYHKPSYLFDQDLCEKFQVCLYSSDFLDRFPIYGKILRRTFRNADQTKYFLTVRACKTVFNDNRKSWCKVTEDVWEHIFSFVTRDDLKNFIASGEEN